MRKKSLDESSLSTSSSESENPSSSHEDEGQGDASSDDNTAVLLPKSVLITGGCGFIGSNFINYIYEKWPSSK